MQVSLLGPRDGYSVQIDLCDQATSHSSHFIASHYMFHLAVITIGTFTHCWLGNEFASVQTKYGREDNDTGIVGGI